MKFVKLKHRATLTNEHLAEFALLTTDFRRLANQTKV